jgi:hypothetical protein
VKQCMVLPILLIAGTLWGQSVSDAPSSSSNEAKPVATITFSTQHAIPANASNNFRSMALIEAIKWAGIVADVETTKAAVSSGRCEEANPLFGTNPGRVRMYGIVGGLGAVHSYFGWKYRRSASNRKLFKITGAVIGGTHGSLALMNRGCL